MQLFSDYVQPIINWLQVHPHWALTLTFIISLAESLAIVGSIIPGSVTMTAIGILAGSGVMRVDLTLLAATLGAVAGDSSSYLLGYVYSDKLNTMWPFSNYPTVLAYGKTYFSRHGGKSVLLGRFVGPLRSIIPLIAGMMHMNHWRFFIANVISAIAWAMLYVLPGVMIGAASNELSPESATRLFALVLVFLGGLWLLSIIIKRLIIYLNRFFSTHFHDFWAWSGKHPRLARIVQLLTPADESYHYQTAALCIVVLLSTLLFLLMTILVINGSWMVSINQPVHLFLQSLRIFSFDVLVIAFSEFISPITLLSLLAFILVVTLYYRDWRSMTYWLSLNIVSGIVLLLCHWLINSPGPEGFFETGAQNSYPAIQLTIATAQFSALLLYINKYSTGVFTRVLNIVLPFILFVNGIAPLYLGDNWVIDVLGGYLAGLSICLFHWIFYRREKIAISTALFTPLVFFLLILSSIVALFFDYEQSTRAHQPYFAQYVFTDQAWWDQKKPLLPIYRTNRIGKRISLFNVQYAGKLSHLEAALLKDGWHKENESLFWSLLKRLNSQQASQDIPLMAQLYLNQKPVLIMTYQPTNGDPAQILRLWRSNYHLKHFRQPIWIGTVSPYTFSSIKKKTIKQHIASLVYVSEALPHFSKRLTPLRIKMPTHIPYFYEPTLLLIKESPSFNVEINTKSTE
ncbi:MAG: VTT domain-containing protein [Legionella sp.]|nr:VTT domain-containing protein [Legionella sp.]